MKSVYILNAQTLRIKGAFNNSIEYTDCFIYMYSYLSGILQVLHNQAALGFHLPTHDPELKKVAN